MSLSQLQALKDSGQAACDQLDLEATDCTVEVPDLIREAGSHATVAIFADSRPIASRMKIYVALIRQAWRHGYNQGKKDLQTELQAKQG